MRHDDQAVDLLVAGIGEREDRPVVVGLAGAHLDAADDAVGAGRGRDLQAVAVGLLAVDRIGQVDRGRVGPHVHGLDRPRRREADQGRDQHRRRNGCAQGSQLTTSVPLGLAPHP